MELLNVSIAQSTWLLDLRDLNPRGRDISSHLLLWLIQNFHFSKYPSSPTDKDKDGAFVFTGGVFQVRDDIFINVDLKVYDVGIVTETRSSTRDSDLFIEHVLSQASSDLSGMGMIYYAEMVRKKWYVSELNVKSKYSLDVINPKMKTFSCKLSKMIGAESGAGFEFASLSYWIDPTVSNRPSNFVFERHAGASFSEQRYFSRAPLQTEDHLALLEEFEELLLG